jgi:RNA polymerase sigma factor (sigma-70 family)
MMPRTPSKRRSWAAWQGFAGFEGRASLRTWLYQIATNRCLNARRSASRRPAKEWDVPKVEPPEPTRLGEVLWLEPYPDALLEGAIHMPLGPEARYEQIESIALAFVTALQVLPPRQLAVLVLRDVLGFQAPEVADMLGSTVESVNSALKRARASLQRRWPSAAALEPPPAPDSRSEDAIVGKFVRAWESADLDAGGPSDGRRIHVDAADARAVTSWPASAPASSDRAGGSTSCRRELTVSRRSEHTRAPPTASATGWASTSSPSPGI